jgi:hypothetical protein
MNSNDSAGGAPGSLTAEAQAVAVSDDESYSTYVEEEEEPPEIPSRDGTAAGPALVGRKDADHDDGALRVLAIERSGGVHDTFEGESGIGDTRSTAGIAILEMDVGSMSTSRRQQIDRYVGADGIGGAGWREQRQRRQFVDASGTGHRHLVRDAVLTHDQHDLVGRKGLERELSRITGAHGVLLVFSSPACQKLLGRAADVIVHDDAALDLDDTRCRHHA